MALGTSVAELDFILKDAGLPASFGIFRTYGLLHREPVPTLTPDTNLALPFYQKTFRIRPGTLGAIRNDAQITIDGTRYVIENIGEVEDDGLQPLTITEVI